ncbi:hypothetical protein CLV80_112120 [Yoonia maritima]|uniref:Uncharacterized protein n=1 Tax=Yoonia maritima TaxID=1435347 RepID=A0A2T0VVS2_9RHOB|nr:hypothetical protein [Yoonia maritima]PRY75533.1 hypothetical protein CLV80_112120 [Yoonia maritima]
MIAPPHAPQAYLTDERALLSSLMQDVQHNIHFNSIAAVLRAYGVQVPPHLGGNCVYHTLRLRALVQQHLPQADCQILAAHDGLHRALCVHLKGVGYILETAAMMPTKAQAIPSQGTTVSGIAFPIAGRNPVAQALFHQDASGQIILTSAWTGPKGRSQRAHSFNLKDTDRDAAHLLSCKDYVRAVARADKALIFRCFVQGFGFLVYFRKLGEAHSRFLTSARATSEKVSDIGENNAALTAFLQTTGLSLAALEASINAAQDCLNLPELCGCGRHSNHDF